MRLDDRIIEGNSMKSMNNEQVGLLERRRVDFKDFVGESMDILTDFLQRLGAADPSKISISAEEFLPLIDSWMSWQIVTPEDRVWIITRIGYFIGELLNQKFSGHWMLDEEADSPYFSQYIVGDFANLPIIKSKIAPFALAKNYVDSPEGRSLLSVLLKVESELRNIIS